MKSKFKNIWNQLKYKAVEAIKQKPPLSKKPQKNHYLQVIKTKSICVSIANQRINADIVNLLIELAESVSLKDKIHALFRGDCINISEQKAALHTALRGSYMDQMETDPISLNNMINENLSKMEQISNKVRQGKWLGYTGKPIKHVVNIGIGGSYLGPKFLKEALIPFKSSSISLEFISNIDPWDIEETLRHTHIEETLFIISSKSFETQETIANMNIVQSLFSDQTGSLSNHFIAVTANEKKALDYGFCKENILQLPDWVGGRYSIWSSISLPVVIAIGMKQFKKFLLGAKEMDTHFLTKPFHQNIPVLLGLIDVWNINFLNAETLAIIPYAKKLKYLVPYLAQLYMESLGKNHDNEGKEIHFNSGAIVWGDIGSNSQHSYHQLLMQGTHFIPCDFILPINSHAKNKALHEELKINCYSQMEALKSGRHDDNPYHEIYSNKPFTLIKIHKITPYSLGKLISMYEHRVFTQATIWNINPFDQYGVELGKLIAKRMQPKL